MSTQHKPIKAAHNTNTENDKMQDFNETFSDAETFAKILGFAFIGAIVISMPYLVIVVSLALSAVAFVAMFAHYVTFEQSFDVATIKADAEFVAHVARVQARQHSSKTKFAMQRARKQKLTVALWDLSVKMSADAGIPFPPKFA